ncbi:hypothetical protein HYS97_03135 [Candidatus Daviesbacteria bacterium]|nr:hypothetical protein [Candidatus Daviesbacteria bacterium]
MDEQNQPSPETAAKKSGIGCGPMLVFLIILVVLVLIGSNAALGYYFKHCGGEELFNCLMGRLEDEKPEGAVTASGVYSFKDYSVTVTASIPLEGGSVTGSISGTCGGKLKGTFDGQNNGVFSGTITGVCDPFFVAIPASAEFSGTVNKDSKVAPISFTGKGGGLTHKDSMSLSY